MKYFFTVFIGLLLAGQLTAQNTGMIKGKLIDSARRQPLALATITVFSAKDTGIITYRLSDPQGEFKVPGIPLDLPCRVVISFSGYHIIRQTFTLTSQRSQLDLGAIPLSPDMKELDEVLVLAERPPVLVKKDTIEFNATAFKTLPTALVEDLLKKLPGIELDKDGNITVNGRAVNRILVDGKEFFGGDPKVATRNLPANIIDKVQVVDDKDQLNQDPYINKADLGQVINLKLKKSIKKGWFGKAYAGAGTDQRYETGAILNLFRDTFQVSVLGYTNNLNRAGFSLNDIQNIGGFSRGGINSISISNDGGVSVNDVSFGGTGQGIQRSTGTGININHDLGKKLTLNLQYFYGHINSQFDQISNIRQTIRDTVLNNRNTTSQESNDHTHRVNLNLRWRPDSLTTILYGPRLAFRKNPSDRNYTSFGSSNYEDPLNESQNMQHIDRGVMSYDHELTYARNFKKKGRALFLGNAINVRRDQSDQQNDVTNKFYNGPTGNTNLHQLRDRNTENYFFALGTTYTEPLTDKLSVRFMSMVNKFKNDDNLQTFNRDPITGKYEEPNPGLSNAINRSGLRSMTGLGFRLIVKKFTITLNGGIQTIDIDNSYAKSPSVKQNYTYLLPNFQVSYGKLNLNYRINVNEPGITDLQPVTDNTDPLYLRQGNPELVPTKTHSFSLNFNKYDAQKLVQYSMYLNGNIDEDGIIRERTVDGKGVQITRPVNVDGVWRASSSANISKQFKYRSGWQLSFRAGIWANFNKGLVMINSIRSQQKNWQLNPSVNWAFNWKDLFEFNQRYSPGWNKTFNSNRDLQNFEVVSHNLSHEIVVRLPKHFVWESSIDYSFNPDVAEGLRKNNTRWNAALNYLFLKDDKGQLKLSVFDLLDQNISVSRSVRENYVQDNQVTVLRRYFLLTFTYNIRKFGDKVGSRAQQLFRF